MSRISSSATAPALLLAVSLAAGGLAGCQALGGTAGVMPETEVGLPPSLRGAMPNRQAHSASVDEEGRPLPAAPTRNIAIPKNAGSASRSADASERRIRREDLEGSDGRSGSSSSMAPALTPGGAVGLGGKF
ncbi:hypothetical protein ACFQE0_07910 [Methylobacterium komagatae]|uniref:Translation initiation factor IF-2 n=1 Tax=Methylobacterium komagatae TaxID=374425 RepID=A0ABW2BGP3_9HYPH